MRLAFQCVFIVSLTSFLAGCNGLSSATAPPTTSPRNAEFVYTIADSSVAGFQVQPDAKLQSISGLPSAGNLNPERLVESPDGKWLFTITGCPPNSCPDRGKDAASPSIQWTIGSADHGGPGDPRELKLWPWTGAAISFTRSLRLAEVPPVDSSTGCSGILQTLNAYAIQSNGSLQPLSSSVRTVDGGFCPMAGSEPVTRMIGFHQDAGGNFLWLIQDDLGRGTDDPSLLSIPVAANGTLGALKQGCHCTVYPS